MYNGVVFAISELYRRQETINVYLLFVIRSVY